MEVYNLFIKKYLEILEDKEIKVICGSGSLLKGIDPLIYNTLIEEGNKRGIKFILDTSGSTLVKGIEAKPFLIKPNQEELEDILGRKLNSIEEIAEAARELRKKELKMLW